MRSKIKGFGIVINPYIGSLNILSLLLVFKLI